MGTVTNLNEFRQKKSGENELHIKNQAEYIHYLAQFRELQRTLENLNERCKPPTDPNDPKRVLFVDYTRERLTTTIEIIEKALISFSKREFIPTLLKAVDDGDLTTALPKALPDYMMSLVRVVLTEEYHRKGFLIKRLNEELNNDAPFRANLIPIIGAYTATQGRIKQALLVNGWFIEDEE